MKTQVKTVDTGFGYSIRVGAVTNVGTNTNKS